MNRKTVPGAGRSVGHAGDAGERAQARGHLDGGTSGRAGRPAGVGVVAGQPRCRRPISDALFCGLLWRMAQVAHLSAVGVTQRSITAQIAQAR
jgi:hypothetical protein